MANNDNLKGKGFDSRTASEVREIASKGGRASGESRRRKADFRRTLNALLTTEIDSPEWSSVLKAMGLESTLESVINAAMIKEAMQGDVKAYEAIAKYSGQTARTDGDLKEQRIRTSVMQSKSGALEGEDVENDGFLEALKGTAGEDWKDER